ncbi:C2 domain [Pseudocohnilembus persalinus]|uniref:C2 domain n=1 Tax=Pseudocohnilembus persalinus TaxID=266149 RepID=A0A0V0QNQ9_PSEPJ|nr:C2 domain [Pseudocohnilembus persalinus]|eukprot:KRX03788.1 C2 domain [Pseudocohnilembus persalinus]
MGSCTSCNNKQKKSYDKYQQLEIMLDPAEQISFDKSVRKFKVQFQKIKVKNVPSVNSYVHVNFDNQHAFETPLQKNQNFNGAWKINHEFVYEISDERLKKEAYVLFIIKDKQGIDLGKVKISLQLIATGPYHHDIQIHWKQVSPELKKQDEDLKDVGSFPGRLQFDLKMSQEIKFEILPKSLTCKMYEDVAETYKLTQQYNSLQRQTLIQQSSTQPGIKQNSTGQISLEKYFKYQDDGVKHPLSHFKPVSGNRNLKNDENQQDGLMTKNIDLKFIDKIGHSNNNQTNNTNGGIVNANINNLNVSGELQNQLKKAEDDNKKVSQNQIDNINQYVHDNTDIQQIRKSVFDIEQQQFLAEEEFDPNLMEEKRRRIKPEGKTSLFNNIINNDIFYYDDNQQQKMMSEKNMISWEYLGLASEQIPDILMELYSKDISNTTIQIQIWGVQPNQQVLDYIANNQEDTQNQIQMPLFEMSIVGECYIGLTKFLITQPEYKLNNKGEIISERRNHFSEVLRKDGIAVGQIEGDFIIINNHFLKQMVLGVMTQDGIRKNSSAIYQPVISDPKQQFDPVDELTQAKDQLLDVVFKHQKKIGMEKIRLKRDIKKNIQIIQDLLSQKHKQSVHSFYYKNREELYKSQSLLIELANHLYEYADEDDQVYLKPLYYDCLKLIMNRGEFNLETIGFSDEFKIFIDRNFNVKNMNKKQKELYKIFKKKLKIGLEYQQLMYHTLDICLKKINIKALIEQEQQFIENFLALAYFKITKFREKILEIIIRKDDESKIPEWRGTERQLEDSGHLYKSLQKQNQTQLNQHTKYFQSFFDWDQGFYQYMLSTLEGDANEQQLISIINQEEWQKKIGKRGIAFFFFLNEWAKYVSNTVIVNEQLPWYDLPGYKQIIKAFLLEMKSRDLDKYPDALKNASVSLLHNEKLLNIMNDYINKHFARTQDTIEKLHLLYSEKKKKEMQRLKKFHKTKSNLQTLKEQLQKRKEQNQYLAEAQKLLNQQKLRRFKSNFVKSAQKVKRKGLLEQAIEQCQPEYDYKVQQPNTDESSLLENASQILNNSSISRNLASKYHMSVKGNALNNQKIDNIDKMHPHTTSVIKDFDEPDLEQQEASDPLEVQQLRRYSNPNQDLQMIQLKNRPYQQQINNETEFISGELKLKKKNSSLNDHEHDSRVDFLNNLNNLNNFNGFNSLKTVENEPNTNNNYHNIQENNKQFNHVKNFIMPERYQSVNQRPTYLDKNNQRENLINTIQQNKLLQTNMTASRERQKTSQLVSNNNPSQYNKQLYNNSPQIGDMFQYSRKFSHQEFTPVKFKEFSAEQQTTMLKKNFLKENPFLIKKNAGYIDAKNEPQIREMTIQQIESQYIKYLDDSMQEYKKVKETYLSWYAQNLNLISHLPPNTQKKIMMELMVPDIKIQQSMDEGERNISDNWTAD